MVDAKGFDKRISIEGFE